LRRAGYACPWSPSIARRRGVPRGGASRPTGVARMAILFLKCLAKAAAKGGGKALAGPAPGGEALYEIAVDTWQDYRKQRQPSAIRDDLGTLARADPAEGLAKA